MAEVPLVRVARAGTGKRPKIPGEDGLDARAGQLVDDGSRDADVGHDDRASRVSPGGSISGSFGAPNVTVSVASITGPMEAGSSADSPLGRSTATTGVPPALRSRAIAAARPSSGLVQARAEQGVDDDVPPEDVGPVPFPVAGRRTSMTPMPRRPRMSRFRRASPLMPAVAPMT